MNKLGGYFNNSAYHEYYNEMYGGAGTDEEDAAAAAKAKEEEEATAAAAKVKTEPEPEPEPEPEAEPEPEPEPQDENVDCNIYVNKDECTKPCLWWEWEEDDKIKTECIPEDYYESGNDNYDKQQEKIKQREVKFQFTRHLLSCNNIANFANKDYEPSASVYGIISTIKFKLNDKNQDYFNSNHIYVSNLLRTWITAFLLYGINNKPKSEITLYISPYLKELHKYGFIQMGNHPEDIYLTANKFLTFLITLQKYVGDENLKDVDANWYENLPIIVKLKLPPSKEFGSEIQEIK